LKDNIEKLIDALVDEAVADCAEGKLEGLQRINAVNRKTACAGWDESQMVLGFSFRNRWEQDSNLIGAVQAMNA
jgi:hypothetical protein